MTGRLLPLVHVLGMVNLAPDSLLVLERVLPTFYLFHFESRAMHCATCVRMLCGQLRPAHSEQQVFRPMLQVLVEATGRTFCAVKRPFCGHQQLRRVSQGFLPPSILMVSS